VRKEREKAFMNKKILTVGCANLVVLLAVLVVLFLVLTGPEDTAEFPASEASPYLLPWRAGISRLCVQGVRGIVSHRGDSRFAYDFYMPVGTEICAARGGEVVRVVQEHEGNGIQWPNNLVVIRHEDGTRACYAHIRKNGSLVKQGQRVQQGDVIAASGNVGNSMMPHLHFHVVDADKGVTMPITFRDVHRHGGIPRMFFWYVAGQQ